MNHLLAECQTPETPDEILNVQIASMVSSGMSLFGSSFLLVSLLRYGNNKFHTKLIGCMAISDFGWSLEMFLNYLTFLIGFRTYKDELVVTTEEAKWGCLFRGLYQFFAGSSLCWTSAFALYLLFALKHNYEGNRKMYIAFNIFCWGIPAIIDISLMLLRDSTRPFCIPKHPYQLVLWGNFILIGFAFNMIVYGLIMKQYIQMTKSVPSLRKAPVTNRLSLFVLSFLFCWFVNFLSIMLNYSIQGYCRIYWLNMLLVITLNFNGALNCIVFFVTNNNMRKNYSMANGFFTFLCSPFIVLPLLLYTFINSLSPKNDKQMNSSSSLPKYRYYSRVNESSDTDRDN